MITFQHHKNDQRLFTTGMLYSGLLIGTVIEFSRAGIDDRPAIVLRQKDGTAQGIVLSEQILALIPRAQLIDAPVICSVHREEIFCGNDPSVYNTLEVIHVLGGMHAGSVLVYEERSLSSGENDLARIIKPVAQATVA